MPEVHYITVHIGGNRIVEGYYTLDDGILTMTEANGEPVIALNGAVEGKVQRRLMAGEKPHQVAGYLTKEIRSMVLDEKVEGFSDPINYGQASGRNPLNYPKLGVA